MSRGLLVYGDPHGCWEPLLRACEQDPPDGVVILGDCDLALPLREQIKPVFEAGIRVRWIPGNHDTDTPEWHDRLWGDYPEGNLHARSAQFGNLTVAGLGGIFERRICHPQHEDALSGHVTRESFIRQLHPSDRWRGGLPLQLRAAIFPEDVEALAGLCVRVLVTHEAPSCHRHGFAAIDRAADLCCARLVVHGHHHESVAGVLPSGAKVRGLGKAEVLQLQAEDVP